MNKMYDKVLETAHFLAKYSDGDGAVGIVLGTGLSQLLHEIVINHTIPYQDIPNFPIASVEFHKGNLIFGKIQHKPVIVMQGRLHYYEGYSMQEIIFPIRVMKQLGISHLLLSNAAGGLNPAFRKGNLVVIEDHLNFLPDNPLRGVHEPFMGSRFPDMSSPYSNTMNRLIYEKATEQSVSIQSGVYAAVMGPNLETRAEYRYLRGSGADMVGMSTVPEVIVSNQSGIPCAAISVITDECDPDNLQPVNIEDIIAVAGKADLILSKLMQSVVSAL